MENRENFFKSFNVSRVEKLSKNFISRKIQFVNNWKVSMSFKSMFVIFSTLLPCLASNLIKKPAETFYGFFTPTAFPHVSLFVFLGHESCCNTSLMSGKIQLFNFLVKLSKRLCPSRNRSIKTCGNLHGNLRLSVPCFSKNEREKRQIEMFDRHDWA